MRLCIPGQPLADYVTACMWPRSRYVERGRIGAEATNIKRRNRPEVLRDLEEVRGYMEDHPGATIRDVAMCCNLSDNHARKLVRRARVEV